MQTILTAIHVIGSLVLIVIILLQSGKGQGVAAGLGGASGAAKKMFGGGRTQSALGKATIAIGSLYLFTSISLAFLSSQPESAMDLQKGDENFGASRGTVLEVGGDGNEEGGGDESGASESTDSESTGDESGASESTDSESTGAESGASESSGDDSAESGAAGSESGNSASGADEATGSESPESGASGDDSSAESGSDDN